MTFPDKSAGSVHSLLALLRSSQGDGNAPSSSSNAPHQTYHGQLHQHPAAPPSIPSKRQLDDLISSLNARPPPRPPKDSPNRHLIEPFGPVGQTPSPSKLPYDAQIRVEPHPSTSKSPETDRIRRNSAATPPKKVIAQKPSKHPRERVDEDGYAEMSFGKALPILTELLGEETLKRELKRMKSDQDALERRLWAKGEKVKAEHNRGIQAEKEVAKIARKPIPSEKKAEWARSLSSSLRAFYADQCLPSMDGLALRQRQRLVELGVPGLGGNEGDLKAKERVKRIMDVLEAGMEE